MGLSARSNEFNIYAVNVSQRVQLTAQQPGSVILCGMDAIKFVEKCCCWETPGERRNALAFLAPVRIDNIAIDSSGWLHARKTRRLG